MGVYSDPYLIFGIVAIFACGFGCGRLTKRAKVITRDVPVPVKCYEPRQKRDDKGRFLAKENPGV